MDACFCQARLQDNPNPAVRVVLSDRVHLETVDIEYQTIVIDLRCGDIADGRSDCRFGGLAEAEKIKISCGPVLLSDADGEEHGTLQNEPVSVFRLPESI